MTLWHLTPLQEGSGGGVQLCLLAEARSLAAAGVHVTVHVRSYQGTPAGYRVHQSALPLWMDGHFPLDRLAALAYYAGVASRSLRADVLDAHNAPFAAAMSPARTLVTVQALPVLPGYAHLWRRYRQARWACVSASMRDDLSTAYPRLDPERMAVLHLGVDAQVFTPRAGPRQPGPLRLLYAGQWASIKGIFVLMDAIDRLSALEGTLPPFELWLAGSARLWPGLHMEQQAPPIERQVLAWAQRHPNVRLVGAVPHDQMPDLYRAVDMLVVPSESETFGVVIIEAMACEVPVVAFPVGGIPEIVVDGETGTLVREHSAEALAAALAATLRDQDGLHRMGAFGRRRVLAHFTWRAHMAALWELYQRVNPRVGPNPF